MANAYDPGTVLGGRYRLEREIARGGVATIWEAVHLTLNTRVAVKFLLARTPDMNERFVREAQLAASVRHQNVVEIMDFGTTPDGTPYMVMELLHGASLAHRMEQDPPPNLMEILRIVSLTLRGLSAVHDAGITHRDLKPDNIFLVVTSDGVLPKLLDFGISRPALAGDTAMTQDGIIMGTPDYMSPEQARGLPNVDARSDVYSMGVILYEAVSGRLPFEADHVGDLIVKITTEEPTPLAEFVPNVLPELRALIETSISRDPEHRYQDARAMRDALFAAFPEDIELAPSGLASMSEFPSVTTGRGLKISTVVDSTERQVALDRVALDRGDPSTGSRREDDSAVLFTTQERTEEDDSAGKIRPIDTYRPSFRPGVGASWWWPPLALAVLAGAGYAAFRLATPASKQPASEVAQIDTHPTGKSHSNFGGDAPGADPSGTGTSTGREPPSPWGVDGIPATRDGGAIVPSSIHAFDAALPFDAGVDAGAGDAEVAPADRKKSKRVRKRKRRARKRARRKRPRKRP